MDIKALIIDDDRSERRMVGRILNTEFELIHLEAENGKQALETLKDYSGIRLVILDLEMPVMDGHETLKQISQNYPSLPVIVLTGSKNMSDAVNVMKNGAFDFLSKPLERERLIVSARNALKMSMMTKEISRLKRHHEDALQFSDLIGYDSGLAECVFIGMKAANNSLPILIDGETGTGKEMFARAIHGESVRAGEPFIAVNCGALPEKLVESTLFGHEKGAFTGAVDKALGKFQEANGGTLFLDEIGELPPDAQVKFLRALQQKEVEPVGAGKAVKVDVRVISATNRHLEDEVKEGRFREDLFFRLNVLQINLPALRNRPGDIQQIAEHFIELFASSHTTSPKRLSEMAMKRLEEHPWPGNVRELENVISRAMALSEGNILDQDDLYFHNESSNDLDIAQPNTIKTVSENGDFKPLKTLEDEIIKQALKYHGNNISQTARVLGIAKSTLYAKLPEETSRSTKTDVA